MKDQRVPSEKGIAAFLARLLGHKKWGVVAVPAFVILQTLIVSGIFLLILGKNPATAFYSFLAGNGFAAKGSYGSGTGMLSDFFSFLNIMAPMLLAALSFVFAYRCGLFNIGIAGQMLASGYCATILVGYSKLPAGIARPMVILTGIIAGALLGAFVGFLKYRFNIHEVVSTIMINYIISYLTGFFINKNYVDSITRSSRICSSASRLTLMKVNIGGYYCNVPLGIFLAIAMAFVVRFIFESTVFGFELRAVGSNSNAATYAGVDVGSRIVISMMLSGALAGMAGVTYYLGYTNTIIPKNLAGMGYDAIATALLGNNSPLGAIFASLLITIFQNGSNYMSSMLGVAKEIASVITGILLLFSACSGFVRYLAGRRLDKIEDEKRSLLKQREAVSAEMNSGGTDASEGMKEKGGAGK